MTNLFNYVELFWNLSLSNSSSKWNYAIWQNSPTNYSLIFFFLGFKKNFLFSLIWWAFMFKLINCNTNSFLICFLFFGWFVRPLMIYIFGYECNNANMLVIVFNLDMYPSMSIKYSLLIWSKNVDSQNK